MKYTFSVSDRSFIFSQNETAAYQSFEVMDERNDLLRSSTLSRVVTDIYAKRIICQRYSILFIVEYFVTYSGEVIDSQRCVETQRKGMVFLRSNPKEFYSSINRR